MILVKIENPPLYPCSLELSVHRIREYTRIRVYSGRKNHLTTGRGQVFLE